MKKCGAILLGLFAAHVTGAKPPELMNVGYTCYQDALLWNLLNIPELNEAVVGEVTKTSVGGEVISFGGELLPTYVPIVQAVVGGKPVAEKDLKEFHDAFVRDIGGGTVRGTLKDLLLSASFDFVQAKKDAGEKIKKFIEKEKAKKEKAVKEAIEFFEKKEQELNKVKEDTLIDFLASLPGEYGKMILVGSEQQDASELYGKLVEFFIIPDYATKAFVEKVRKIFEVIHAEDTGFFNFYCPMFIEAGGINKSLEECLTKLKEQGLVFAGDVRAPGILVFSLEPNPSAVATNGYLTIPDILDMEPYHPAFKGAVYKLVSAVLWSGGGYKTAGSTGGHYTAYVNDLYASVDTWYRCDDVHSPTVSLVGPQLTETDKKNIDGNCRMLFYKKLDVAEAEKVRATIAAKKNLANLTNSLASLAQASLVAQGGKQKK